MDFKWLVVVLLNGFIFVYCSDCGTDKLQYLAKIEIAWEDYEKELVQRGLGSLIHPYYVLTAGTFVVDYYQFHSDDRKYPSMTVEFPNSDYASGFTFKVQEVIIIPHIYNPRSTDFALIKLEERPKFSPAYLRALYKNKQITLSTSKQYYLGTLTGIMNITPTDPDSILILSIIDTTSEDDYLVFDDKIGAPLLFCDQTRDHYVQAGIYSIVNTTSAHQRNTNLLMLTEHIYEYIAEQSFSKCYAKQRINDGESRFHNRAHLGDGVVHIYATVYSAEGKPRQRRCSGSFFSEEAIYTSATCLKDYVAERNKHQVSPELYETYNNMTYKMVVEVGFKDEVHHPHTIITEKNIKQITLDPNYNPESGASDTAFVAFNKRISDFIDTGKFSSELLSIIE